MLFQVAPCMAGHWGWYRGFRLPCKIPDQDRGLSQRGQEEEEKEEGWETISDGTWYQGKIPQDKGRQAVRQASLARHALSEWRTESGINTYAYVSSKAASSPKRQEPKIKTQDQDQARPRIQQAQDHYRTTPSLRRKKGVRAVGRDTAEVLLPCAFLFCLNCMFLRGLALLKRCRCDHKINININASRTQRSSHPRAWQGSTPSPRPRKDRRRLL